MVFVEGTCAGTGCLDVAVGSTEACSQARWPSCSAPGWPAYLNGPLHSSYAPAQTAITPASAPQVAERWHHAPGRNYLASPTVADGAVFIGADGGWFYKLGLTTGAVLAKR